MQIWPEMTVYVKPPLSLLILVPTGLDVTCAAAARCSFHHCHHCGWWNVDVSKNGWQLSFSTCTCFFLCWHWFLSMVLLCICLSACMWASVNWLSLLFLHCLQMRTHGMTQYGDLWYMRHQKHLSKLCTRIHAAESYFYAKDKQAHIPLIMC